MSKKYSLTIGLFSVLGVLLTLMGVTYSWLFYGKDGIKQVSITTNGMTFSYMEGQKGLSLNEAMPMTDEIGKMQTDFFEFDVNSTLPNDVALSYFITARKSKDSDDIDDAIKLYLTSVDSNGNEEEIRTIKFDELGEYYNSSIDLSKHSEKVLYSNRIVSDINKKYRLRMWIDYDTNFLDEKYNGKKFEINLNLYATRVNNDIYAKSNGALHVSESKLMNAKNQPFRLVGVSNDVAPQAPNAHLASPTKMYTKDSFLTLKNWGANGFRIFCDRIFWDTNISDYSYYIDELKKAIDNLIANDMYVIINWNPGEDESVTPRKDSAKYFFSIISSYYGNNPHILYEIWNEPTTNKTWADIKEYANEVIPLIRSNAPDSVILVGTPDFDKRVDLVIGDELNFDNIMYTHHTYAGSVNETEMGYLLNALEAGLPIFESETAGSTGSTYFNQAHAYSFSQILKKYNLSYMYFCWEIGRKKSSFVDIDKYDWNEKLPDYILSNNAKWFKKLLIDDYSTNSYLMAENSNDEGLFYRSAEWKDKIVSVSFKNRKVVPDNAVITWDLSFNKDKSVIGYLLAASENDTYDLVICADGYINLPINSKNIFQGLSKVESYDLQYLKTDLVRNLSYAFQNNSALKSLDLSNFNTDNLVYMYGTFENCYKLESINFDGWHPSLVNGINRLFSNCNSLKELDLSNFDVANVSNFYMAFYRNYNLTKLNISTWKPTKVIDISNAFCSLSAVAELDISGFTNFSDDCNYTYIFRYINPEIVIKTGNESFKNNMKAQYPDLNIE